jgi:hypothetical protein
LRRPLELGLYTSVTDGLQTVGGGVGHERNGVSFSEEGTDD